MKYRVVAIKQVEQSVEADNVDEAVQKAFSVSDWNLIAGDQKATLLSVSWVEMEEPTDD
jgi:hypothetical protein